MNARSGLRLLVLSPLKHQLRLGYGLVSQSRKGRKRSGLRWTKKRITHPVLGREPQDLEPWETGRAKIVTCQFGMISLRHFSVRKDGLVTHLQKPGKGVVLAKQA